MAGDPRDAGAPVRAVFFDAGHTLIESMPDVAGIYVRASSELGVQLDGGRLDAILSTLWRTYAETTASVARTAVTDEADKAMWRMITRRVYDALPEVASVPYDDWFERIHDIFVDPDTWQPYAETVETLEALRGMGLRTAVISNWSSNLPHILEHLELDHHFDAVLVSCIEGVRKPDPEIFQRALTRTGVRPSEALHVGDVYEDDVVGAEGVGIRGVLLNRGTRPPRDCTVIGDLSEIVELVGDAADPR